LYNTQAMPAKLIFVRHGHTPNNSIDHSSNRLMGWADDHVGLSISGQQDAKDTAAKLKTQRIDYIYHSDLIRTTETATIITQELGMVSTPTPYLRERNLGNFANLTMHEIKTNRPADWAKFLDHKDPDWNGLAGESLRDMHKRFDAFLRELRSKHQDQNILLISHSGFMHTIFRDYFGFFPVESFNEVGHSSVTILEKRGDKYALVRYNE